MTQLDALSGLPGDECPSIFSAGLVKMNRKPISFGENKLLKDAELFCAGHRFLQTAREAGGHSHIVTRYDPELIPGRTRNQKSAGNPIVITGSEASPRPISRMRVWYRLFVPSIWRITSKAIREHPVFALRAAREAIQGTSHNLPSVSSCEYCCGISSIAVMRGAVAATGNRNPASSAVGVMSTSTRSAMACARM
jgi:hypothetical protein